LLPNSGDREINLKEIGDTIKNIRREKGMKLKEVAEKTGLSNGFLSQVENGQAQISLVNLWKISGVLGVPLAVFFAELDKQTLDIVRKDERKALKLPKSNVSYSLLSPDMSRKIEMLLITLEPGEIDDHETIAHEGEECGFVIEGGLGIIQDGTKVILDEGDSVYLDSAIPHRFFNPGSGKSVSVWAITPPSF